MCQPVALALGQDNPNTLAVDATSVYWTTSDGSIRKAPTAGGDSTTLASGQRFPFGIAVDATSVYWANAVNSGQVMSLPTSGGTPTILADAQARPFKVAVNSGTVFWTNNNNGTVMKVPVSGGTPIPVASTQGQTAAIAVNDGTLYWSSIGQAAIRSLPLEGGTITTIASDQVTLSLFVRDATVFWANAEITNDMSTVFALSTGGQPVDLATSSSPYSAVADSHNVYWTDELSGTVMKVPLEGGAATVIAKDQLFPTEIAIDGSSIYWINAAGPPDGAIMKLAK